VIVLADWLWRSAWNADPAVIGKTALLEGEPFVIVGVLPPSATFPSRDVAAWEPVQLDPSSVNPYQLRFTVVARLRQGMPLIQAREELTGLVRAVGREYPGPHLDRIPFARANGRRSVQLCRHFPVEIHRPERAGHRHRSRTGEGVVDGRRTFRANGPGPFRKRARARMPRGSLLIPRSSDWPLSPEFCILYSRRIGSGALIEIRP
jgi:hypothetical protein